MIPLKLELKNFLSYGDPAQVIDFKDYELICFSGKNGNGKSALLDAISWVLWGQARKVSGTIKADEGLIRLGQARMIVSMEFLCNGQKYRVRREFAKTYGKPYVSLDLNLFDDEHSAFFSLTEKTIKLTQAKIEKTVGLDFNTFANSAFLRQGQSNEFSKKSPKERKQILSSILGLSRYDDLQRLALDYARKYISEKRMLVKIEEHITEELCREKQVKEESDKKNNLLQNFDKQLCKAQKEIEQKGTERLFYLEQKYKFDQLEKEKLDKDNLVAAKCKKLLEFVSGWKHIHAKSLNFFDLKVLERDKANCLEKERRLRELQQKHLILQEDILLKKEKFQKEFILKKREHEQKSYDQKLIIEKQELRHKQLCDQIKQKEKDLTDKNTKCEKCKFDLEKVNLDLSVEEAFQQRSKKLKDQFEKRRSFFQSLVQRGNWLQKESDGVKQKKNIVQEQESPSCPLCEQVLTLKRKKFLVSAFSKQETFLSKRINRISNLIKRLKEILLLQHRDVQKILLQEDQYKQFKMNSKTLIEMQKELDQSCKRISVEVDVLKLQKEQAGFQLTKDRKLLLQTEQEVKIVLKKDKKLLKLQNDILMLEEEKKSVSYSKQEHYKLQEQLLEIEHKQKELEGFKSEFSKQDNRREEIKNLCQEIRSLKKERNDFEQKIKLFDFKPNKEYEFENLLLVLKKQYDKILQDKEITLQQKGSLENELRRFEKLKKENKNRKTEIENFNNKINEYQTLANVFGKDGIQALLIEDAIPEIEKEANDLLSRLTDNKAQIFIESLRDLKKGGARESLDIHISDTAGVRPYEMFSGGEAFRIDFALRIAISKLLARRAGTALQTLIVDEGFGSLDEEGLQQLMDAIYVIRKDFAKVIVVSHLPIFKDNFPVHFVVEKDSMGSFIRVEERG